MSLLINIMPSTLQKGILMSFVGTERSLSLTVDLIKRFSIRLDVSSERFDDSYHNYEHLGNDNLQKKNQWMDYFGEFDSKDSSHWDESQPRPRENSVWIVTFSIY